MSEAILWTAEQSASQASQQAFQQASQSIQQANQSASQAAQRASQSASNSIQQANNSASQLIAAASRSSSSAVSSASSAIASIQASASSAVARANGAMQSAQFTASLLQQEVSKAGATAAMISHLDETPPIARFRSSEGFHARKDIFGPEFKETIFSASSQTPYASYSKAMQERQTGHRNELTTKETYLAWNPKDPPKGPRLNSWLQLRVKGGVSPSSNGPVSLPKSGNGDEKTPLGGKLKSPHSMVLMRSLEIPILNSPPDIESITLNRDQIILPQNNEETDPELKEEIKERDQLTANTRKGSPWTDDMRSTIGQRNHHSNSKA
ncbi:hypothetical protein DID88_005171 [Monilinia fructigena]|uniref:Uncharacterized protein n=1 Tax=Monilinia fructigena TaxID=38457 RepID=A0A395IDM3_9HELO|nr:hypothetical protein DID88_005171 [Monilinia fructigena]